MTRIGDRIKMKGGLEAVIKYIGPIDTKHGQWVGVELSEKIGKHNGTIDGKKYYECKEGCGLLVRYEKFDDLKDKNLVVREDSPFKDNSMLFKECTIKIEDIKQNKDNKFHKIEEKDDVKSIIQENIYLSEINKYSKQLNSLKKIIKKQEQDLEDLKRRHSRELEIQQIKLNKEVCRSNEAIKKLSDTKLAFLSIISSFEQEANQNIRELELFVGDLHSSESKEDNSKDHKKICSAFKNMLNSFIDKDETQLETNIDKLKSLFKTKGIY